MPKLIQLLLKLLLLIAIGGIPYYLYLHKLITENDSFYWKSTYASPTLIIGASRANQGIAPQVLDEKLERPGKALNFAFTGIHTPYGEPYLKLIKRKIDHSHGPGLFILSVHPANIASYEGGNHRREMDFRFYNLWMVNSDPNPEYILRNIRGKQSLLPMIITKIKPKRDFDIIHRNGWTERTTPPELRLKKIDELKAMQYKPMLSPQREAALKETVAYLAQHGQVVMLRMPVIAEMTERENDLFYRDFSAYMQEIADAYGACFLDYSTKGAAYEYNDGIHHLDGPSTLRFTEHLAADILECGK